MPDTSRAAVQTSAGPLRRARGWLVSPQAVPKKRRAIALAVAAAADVIQLAILPAFVEGALSPFEDALDVVVAIALLVILGFKWRLAFAFALELVPGVDLFPTWTAVVWSLPVAPDAPPEQALPEQPGPAPAARPPSTE